MKVCILGAYDPQYTRHYTIIEGLKRVGVSVETVQLPPKSSTVQRVMYLLRHWHRIEADVLFLTAFNATLAPFVVILAWLTGKRLLVDYMIGLSDTALDRQNMPRWKTELFRWIDRFVTQAVPTVTDTQAHHRYFEQLLGVQLPKMNVLPIGIADLPLLTRADSSLPVVRYVGTYIPFHGVDVILHAAKHLPHVQFECVGKGQTLSEMKHLAQTIGVSNVRFIEGYFDRKTLLGYQAKSTIQLGVFGDSDKTHYVVPNKVLESLALGKPMITAYATVLQEVLDVSLHVITVPPNDVVGLAQSIQQLLQDEALQERLRQQGREWIETRYLPQHIGSQLHALLARLVA